MVDRLPVKHAQWMALLKQLLDISLMQGSSDNQHHIVDHVAISGSKKKTIYSKQLWGSKPD